MSYLQDFDYADFYNEECDQLASMSDSDLLDMDTELLSFEELCQLNSMKGYFKRNDKLTERQRSWLFSRFKEEP